MTENIVLRELDALVNLLTKYDFHARANWIKKSIGLFNVDQDQFWEGVNSLDWWDGSGSLADVYLYAPNDAIKNTEKEDDNRRYRAAMVVIYEEMIRYGKENIRGKMWIDTFKKWQGQGI